MGSSDGFLDNPKEGSLIHLTGFNPRALKDYTRFENMEAKILLEAKGVGKRYRKNGFELQPIDVSLKAGEVTGLVGENGNGKTTLLTILAGMLHPDKGALNYAFTDRMDWDKIKSETGYISQSLPTWTGTVYENLHFNATIHGITGATNKKYIDQLVKDLGLWEYRLLDWSELSGGYKMRFELAKVLAGKPKILILDEPLANLDIKAQANFLNDLRTFQQKAEEPLSIIVSSQHLYRIEEVSDHIIFLRKGECLYNGPVDSLKHASDAMIYELVVVEAQHLLENALQHEAVNKFTKDGNTFLVYTKPEMDPNSFLRHLMDHSVLLQAYRDITGSTRQFFD